MRKAVIHKGEVYIYDYRGLIAIYYEEPTAIRMSGDGRTLHLVFSTGSVWTDAIQKGDA